MDNGGGGGGRGVTAVADKQTRGVAGMAAGWSRNRTRNGRR